MAKRQEQHSHGAWNRNNNKNQVHAASTKAAAATTANNQRLCCIETKRTKWKLIRTGCSEQCTKENQFIVYTKNVNSFVEFLSFSRFLRQFQIFHLIFLQHLCRISLVCVYTLRSKYQRNQHCRPFWFIICIYIYMCVYENVANKLNHAKWTVGTREYIYWIAHWMINDWLSLILSLFWFCITFTIAMAPRVCAA